MRRFKYFSLLLATCLLFAGCQNSGNKENISSKETSEKTVSLDKMSESELEVESYDGNADAALELGKRYDFSNPGKSDFAEAYEWYKMADENGNTEACVYLGYLYMNGLGVEKNIDTAIEYFNRAISSKEVEGYSGLCRLYLQNQNLENASSLCYDNAKKSYENHSKMGQFLLGYLYETGYGVQQNISKAKELYKGLADTNYNNVSKTDSYPYCEAACRLGVMFTKDTASDDEKKKSIEYFNKAASLNYAKAYYYEGASYQSGINVDKNSEQAINYYSKAADMKYAPALNQLGYMFFNGYGVDADYTKAIYYFKLAAAQNYAQSQVNLGYIYENGYGVDKDLNLAKQYYSLASNNNFDGSKEAITRVDQLINEANAS